MFFASLGDSSFLPPSDPPDPLMAISSPALPLLTVVTSHRFHTRPLMEWETPPPLTAPPASLALVPEPPWCPLPAPPPGSGLSQRVSVPQIHSCCSPIVWAVRLSPYHTCVYTRPISICCSFAQFPCGVRWSFGSIFHRLRCRWGSGKGSDLTGGPAAVTIRDVQTCRRVACPGDPSAGLPSLPFRSLLNLRPPFGPLGR
jgi:hypothetical protein